MSDVVVSGTPERDKKKIKTTGSVDAMYRGAQKKSSPKANVVLAGSGPANWNRYSGAGGSFPPLAPQQFQQVVQRSPQTVRNVKVQSVPHVTYNPPTSTAGQHPWLTNPNAHMGYMTTMPDYGSSRSAASGWNYVPPLNPPPGPPVKQEPEPPQPQTPSGPLMPPSYWLIKDPDQTGDDIAAAREGQGPWFGVLVYNGQETVPFEEFAAQRGMPPAQAWAMWNKYFSNERPTLTREGTDYWSTGVPFTSTMGTDEMLETIEGAQGGDVLDTYKMVQENPNVISYPYREEDPDGEWQPAFGQPVNPTMAKRPVPKEIPYYDQRGLYEAEILDEMAMRGMPPTAMLDQPGYNPRDQHLYSDFPTTPELVLRGVLERLRGPR